MADKKTNDTQQVPQIVDDCIYIEDKKQFEYRKIKKIYSVKYVNDVQRRTLADSQELPTLFTFSIKREKSTTTKKERLVITAFENQEDTLRECGTIITTVPALQDGILGLREYGVVLPRSAYGVITKTIEANYLSLSVTDIDFEEDITASRIERIFNMCCEYIITQGIQELDVRGKGRTCYNIPSDDFTDMLANSEFRHLDIVEVKKGLVAGEYIFVNAGRYDRNVSGKKCISFDSKKVNEQKEKRQED